MPRRPPIEAVDARRQEDRNAAGADRQRHLPELRLDFLVVQPDGIRHGTPAHMLLYIFMTFVNVIVFAAWPVSLATTISDGSFWRPSGMPAPVPLIEAS